MKSTVFGDLLTNFQKQKKMAIEMGRRKLLQKNKVTTLGFKYRVEEVPLIAKNGETIYRLQLWQLLDEENVKLSANVGVEYMGTSQTDDELRKLMK